MLSVLLEMISDIHHTVVLPAYPDLLDMACKGFGEFEWLSAHL